jgi:hypothetical protein
MVDFEPLDSWDESDVREYDYADRTKHTRQVCADRTEDARRVCADRAE